MARITKAIERWFEVPGDDDGARLKIKHLSPGEVQDIFDKVFVQEINYKKIVSDKKGKKEKDKFEPEFKQHTNKTLDRELTLTSAVVGWENYFDANDKPLECTPENIMLASREIEGFAEIVTELREALAKEIAEEKEGQRKNLLSSALKQSE